MLLKNLWTVVTTWTLKKSCRANHERIKAAANMPLNKMAGASVGEVGYYSVSFEITLKIFTFNTPLSLAAVLAVSFKLTL